MLKKRVLITSLFCLFSITSCIPSISRFDRTPEPIIIEGTLYTNPMAAIEKFAQQTAEAQTRIADPAQPSILAVTPLPHMIDGTPYDNPMAVIEKLAQQTAIAQTQIADPAQPSALFITPIQPNYSIEEKVLHVVFPDGRKVSYSPFELGTFPQTEISVGNQEVIGISLIALLQQAGWDAFDVSAVSLNGIGSLTIPKGQITGDYLLVLTGYSVKFISPSVGIDGLTIIEIY
jgi:hypothetical protein